MPVQVELYELPFLAPVPRDHEVLVATLRRSPESSVLASFVLDRTATVLYCGDTLWGPLDRSPTALHDPLGVLTRYSWVVERSTLGQVAGAMISSSSAGEQNHAQTRLFVVPSSAVPYR